MMNKQEYDQQDVKLHNPSVWTTENELMTVLKKLAKKSPVLAKWLGQLFETSGVWKDNIIH